MTWRLKSKENRGEYMITSANDLKKGLSGLYDALWMVDLNTDSIEIVFDKFKTKTQDMTVSYKDFCVKFAENEYHKQNGEVCVLPDAEKLSEICRRNKAEFQDICFNEDGVPVWYRMEISPFGDEEYDKKVMITIKNDDFRKRKEIFNSALAQNFDYVIYLFL